MQVLPLFYSIICPCSILSIFHPPLPHPLVVPLSPFPFPLIVSYIFCLLLSFPHILLFISDSSPLSSIPTISRPFCSHDCNGKGERESIFCIRSSPLISTLLLSSLLFLVPSTINAHYLCLSFYPNSIWHQNTSRYWRRETR